MDGQTIEPVQEANQVPSLQAQPEESGNAERKARVDAVWEQMNKGVSTKKLNNILNKPRCSSSQVNRNSSKKQTYSASWMTVLGLGSKKTPSSLSSPSVPDKLPPVTHNNCSSDEAKRIAASALSAVKDAAILDAHSGRGGSKIEIKEVRDFAGEDVEVKRLVDANSKEASSASEKGKSSAVDAVLEQIRKKPKLSVLDKTKKDWGEFKEENKLDEELDAYKKSGNQYLEKVSFLQRADYREFERERDVRLALQAKRKPD